MDGGVDFVAVDMPHASRFVLYIMASVAEHERQIIGERTKPPWPPLRRVASSWARMGRVSRTTQGGRGRICSAERSRLPGRSRRWGADDPADRRPFERGGVAFPPRWALASGQCSADHRAIDGLS